VRFDMVVISHRLRLGRQGFTICGL
jgi:hypothetical protein